MKMQYNTQLWFTFTINFEKNKNREYLYRGILGLHWLIIVKKKYNILESIQVLSQTIRLMYGLKF